MWHEVWDNRLLGNFLLYEKARAAKASNIRPTEGSGGWHLQEGRQPPGQLPSTDCSGPAPYPHSMTLLPCLMFPVLTRTGPQTGCCHKLRADSSAWWLPRGHPTLLWPALGFGNLLTVSSESDLRSSLFSTTLLLLNLTACSDLLTTKADTPQCFVCKILD